MSLKNICIYGLGGVGGYVGGKLAYVFSREKSHTPDVFFIARGQHLEEIKRQGLTLHTAGECMVCKATLSTERFAEVPVPDLCILSVKGYDLEAAIACLKKHIVPETVILPLLNGVDIYERIRSQIPDAIILPATLYIASSIESPGVVRHKSGTGKIILGPDPLHPDFKKEQVTDILEQAGIAFEWYADPAPALWEKFLFIASFGLVSALTFKTLGQIIENEEDSSLVKDIIQEIYLLAQKKGIRLTEEAKENAFSLGRSFPYECTTSYQRDVMGKGAKNEGELFGGAILGLAKELQVPTPVTEAVYSEINRKLVGKI